MLTAAQAFMQFAYRFVKFANGHRGGVVERTENGEKSLFEGPQ